MKLPSSNFFGKFFRNMAANAIGTIIGESLVGGESGTHSVQIEKVEVVNAGNATLQETDGFSSQQLNFTLGALVIITICIITVLFLWFKLKRSATPKEVIALARMGSGRRSLGIGRTPKTNASLA